MTRRATYREIAEHVRRLIEHGELAVGTMVPSELALAEQYVVSRGTVRSALALLVDEGLVEVIPGRGRRVAGIVTNEPPFDTAWERIAYSLRQGLDSGQFGAAMPMPSESELMDEFGVSRNTVRRAYQHLVDAGLVIIRHGAGAFPVDR